MNMLAKVQGTKFQVYLLNSDQIKNACLMVFGAMTVVLTKESQGQICNLLLTYSKLIRSNKNNRSS